MYSSRHLPGITLAARITMYSVIVMLALGPLTDRARAQSVELGGRAFLDYFYTFTTPNAGDDGLHGFMYRRLYLTADFELSEDFSGRARLEANDGSVGSSGPVAFVKDLWLMWNYAGEHSATVGVTPPPAYRVSEDVWGFRSLEKTVLDLQDVVDSRDFGIRLDGPIAVDVVRYSVMFANNSGRLPESDRYKRAYAQIEFYSLEALAFTLGADHAGYGDDRESTTQINAFAGYSSDQLRLGVETYWSNVALRFMDDERSLGMSLFGIVDVLPKWEAVARVDRIRSNDAAGDWSETFVLAGLSYAPIENVRIIPNVWFLDDERTDEIEALGRLTIDVRF